MLRLDGWFSTTIILLYLFQFVTVHLCIVIYGTWVGDMTMWHSSSLPSVLDHIIKSIYCFILFRMMCIRCRVTWNSTRTFRLKTVGRSWILPLLKLTITIQPSVLYHRLYEIEKYHLLLQSLLDVFIWSHRLHVVDFLQKPFNITNCDICRNGSLS